MTHFVFKSTPIFLCSRYLSNIRKALSTGEPINIARLDMVNGNFLRYTFHPSVEQSCDTSVFLLLQRLFERKGYRAYRTLINKQEVYIHPSSALYKKDPPPGLYTSQHFFKNFLCLHSEGDGGRQKHSKYSGFF